MYVVIKGFIGGGGGGGFNPPHSFRMPGGDIPPPPTYFNLNTKNVIIKNSIMNLIFSPFFSYNIILLGFINSIKINIASGVPSITIIVSF